MISTETKICSRCKQDKSISEFGVRKNRPGGLQSTCRSCNRELSRDWRSANPRKVAVAAKLYKADNAEKLAKYDQTYWSENKAKLAADARLRKYGISQEQFDELLKTQNGQCAVCQMNFADANKAAFVDHCHATGRVRGLLCTKCNSGIGLLGDTLERLEAAVAYLKGSVHYATA
jgi:hypothetical protein